MTCPTAAMVDDAQRFMGLPPAARTAQSVADVRAVFVELMGVARHRFVWQRLPVAIGDGRIRVADDLDIESRDLTTFLDGCRECVLLASTLGPEVDRAIGLAGRLDMWRGLAMDACASVWADACCDTAEAMAAAELADGEFFTARFSPGYGDVPLEASAGVIALLDATRRIGLTMTKSRMMAPVKSITALLGVSDRPSSGDWERNCAACPARAGCELRKRGEVCGR